jgi:hypothetical protein
MSSTNSIFINFKLTNSEYEDLNNRFGRLCYKIFSELKRKNSRNNYTEELDDNGNITKMGGALGKQKTAKKKIQEAKALYRI